MEYMFYSATAFNQNISNWDVSSVTNMESMFQSAAAFNQNLSSWNVDGVTSCNNLCENTTSWTLPKPNFTNCDTGD
jgi:surface protein